MHDNTAGEIEAISDKAGERDEAIIDKIAGGEAVHDNTAGERVEEFTVESSVETVHEAAERVKEFIVEPSAEAIIEAVEESRLYVWPPKEVKGPRIESRPQ